MDSFGGDKLTGRRRLVSPGIFFLVLWSAFFASRLSAQDMPVPLLSPRLPAEGQTFTLTILVPHANAAEVQAAEEGFPDSIALVSGPNISPVTMNGETETQRQFTQLRYTFRARRAGRSVLEPIAFRVRGTEFFTQDMILEISRSRDSLVPFDLVWRPLADEVYEGQSVAALLEMRGLAEITVPEALSVPKPAGALFEEVKALGGISSVSAGGREIYSMAVSSWMLTPSASGRVILPPARVKALGLTLDCAPRAIIVRGLPPEVKSTGAVGKLKVKVWTDREEVFQGETVSLFFRVTGEGNLNYLQPPELGFEDILITGRETTQEIEPFDFGYRGWVQWVFRLSPQKAGAFSLRIPAFSWMNPETHGVETFRGMSLRARVLARQNTAEISEPGRREILRSWDVEACEPWDVYARPYMYAFIIPCAFLFARGIPRVRKKNRTALAGALLVSLFLLGAAGARDAAREEAFSRVDLGAAAYDSGDYAEADRLFTLASEDLPGSPGVYYNLGLTREALRDAAGSVFWLRKAVFRNPSAAFIGDRLREAEKTFGVTHAVSAPRIHPDVFFAVFAAVIFTAAVLPWFIRKRTILFACLTALFLAAAFSGGGMAWQAASLEREWAVVASGGSPLRKIPLPEASEWLELAEGTAIDIVSRSGGFVLVSTGSGIEGWMEEDSLYGR
ncbi:MAG: BatD family protein [Spirochaetales bacterium]|jgi:tetratricopeptide (TPR) repeat protein|nr:BatD family protein [Spirochaetales bacterium]